VVARFDVGVVVGGGGDGERHLDLAAVERPRDLEADALEDADHRRVVGHHLAHELLDPARPCKRGESLEHPRRDPSPLVVVGDCERDLGGSRIAQAHVVREGHDPVLAVLGHRGEECTALRPVRVEHGLDEASIHAWDPVEPQEQAALRQFFEEADEPSAIGFARLAQAQRASVAEDDVDRLVLNHGHGRIVADEGGLRIRCRPGGRAAYPQLTTAAGEVKGTRTSTPRRP